MENQGTIAEVLQKCKVNPFVINSQKKIRFFSQPNSDDLKQHALIRLATEKSLQSDIKSFISDAEYVKSWQPLLIMYQSRHEKRLAWKEKSQDFEKIEQALVDQQKELEEIEEKLPKPLKIKPKKSKEKARVTRSKDAVVYVLDLENKTAEPFGNQTTVEEEEEKVEEQTEAKPIPSSSTATVINDPFFLNSQHQITYQKRTKRDKNETDMDDKSFIEHSYFIDALSSSSNRRDGGGIVAKQKWAHLSPLTRPRSTSDRKSNGIFIDYSLNSIFIFIFNRYNK
jgi:hypothetical protein